MYFTEITFGTPLFDQAVDLRNRLLRIPLDMEYYVSDIEKEWSEYHFGILINPFQLVACLSMRPVNPTELKMRQVAVESHLQGQGLGTALVDRTEQWCLFHGFNTISLHARETAIPFYKRLDYRIVGEQFTEVNIPHVKMVKQLT